jgi:predicted metal-dependent hydrolase
VLQGGGVGADGEEVTPADRSPVPATGLGERRVHLHHAQSLDPAWNPRYPELAFAVDGVSLLMPYAEPYFVRTVRAALPDLEPGLRATAAAFCAQEARHHGEHRRFNDRIAEDRPGIVHLERWIDRSYGWLERHRSRRFSLAFAAASETIAFSIARWADRHHHELFDDVDPATADLFQWHLAEEVEHKSVAFDVYSAVDPSRLRYLLAAAATFSILAWFTMLTVFTLLFGSGRWRTPGCWLRLPRWALGIAFRTMPDLMASCLPGHHPSQLVDPPGLVASLREMDRAAAGPTAS